MSSSSTSEKDLRSLDEDSGHDSIEEIYSSPAEDRERIEHLETVVTWIRQEVQNLKDYDQDILSELWKIRSGIQDLQNTHKRSQEAESKYLDDTIPDRSPSPEDLPTINTPQDKPPQRTYIATKKSSPEASPSPAQSHTQLKVTPSPSERLLPGNRCNTLDLMRTAPSHLMMSDEQLLEQFFGTDQVEKLNQFKKSLDDEKEQKEKEESEYEDYLRKNVGKKLEIPVNPYRKSSRYSCDVASEMEQLRARLHETAFKELEEFDKKFSPKLAHPRINPASGESSHSRQGSLDSSFPPQPQLNSPQLVPSHRRDHSLPVYMDPSASGSPQSASGNSSPFTSRSATQLLRNQVGEPVVVSCENDIRSPTPPLQYGHIRQMSAGSNSSGSGTFSPPPANSATTQGSHQLSYGNSGGLSVNMPRYGGSGGALNRYGNYDQASKLGSAGNSPTSRAPNPHSPHFHSLNKQQPSQAHQPVGGAGQGNSSLPRTVGSGGGGGGGGGSGLVAFGTNLSLTRNSGGTAKSGVTANHPITAGTNNASLNRIRQQVLPNPASNGVVMRRPESNNTTQTHYSTSVIKKRKSSPSPDRNSRRSFGEDFQMVEPHLEGGDFGHHHQPRNDYPVSGSQGSAGHDQVRVQSPEQRGVSKTSQQQRLIAPYERITNSPKMARKPMKPNSSVTSTATSSPQSSAALRKSEPNLLPGNGPSVYPETIQPYMSSGDVKGQLKYFKYTPYTDGGKSNTQNGSNRNSQEVPESTWC